MIYFQLGVICRGYLGHYTYILLNEMVIVSNLFGTYLILLAKIRLKLVKEHILKIKLHTNVIDRI